jgi:hypothetical protein
MNVENLLGTHIKKINFEENTAVYENAERREDSVLCEPKIYIL